MPNIAVIQEPAVAKAVLAPIRSRILAALAEPSSAAMLAGSLGVPRQRLGYHLKELERRRLIELTDERSKRNLTERVYQATAASYLISPDVLAVLSPNLTHFPHKLAANRLLAIGSRLIQEVGQLLAGGFRTERQIASFGIDVEIRFATAADRGSFAKELAKAVESLLSCYHDEAAPDGKSHRMIVGLHQIPAALPNLSGTAAAPPCSSEVHHPSETDPGENSGHAAAHALPTPQLATPSPSRPRPENTI